MAPAMSQLTDLDIQSDVLDELNWTPNVKANEIGVAVKEGVVTLTGTVESYLARQAAQDAALRVRGVHAVANEIEVRLHTSAERTDSDLALAIRKRAQVGCGDSHRQAGGGRLAWFCDPQGTGGVVLPARSRRPCGTRLAGVKAVSNLIIVAAHPPQRISSNASSARWSAMLK